jgi:hypothetical protein
MTIVLPNRNWSIVNIFQVSPCGIKSKTDRVNVPLIEVAIMSLWRRRQDYSAAMIGSFFITLAQIGLIFAAVLMCIKRFFG